MITLKDYLGFIMKEIVDARVGLDQYAAQLAQEMAKDEIMKHFHVPRFKVPEMDLNIPVLISGAKYTSTIRFIMEKATFDAYVLQAVNQKIQTLKIRMQKTATPILPPGAIIKPPLKTDIFKPIKLNTKGAAVRAVVDHLAGFHSKLIENTIPSFPDNIVKVFCENIFYDALEENQIKQSELKPEHKFNELGDEFEALVLQKVKENTVIVRNELKNLLVNPETHLVKENSNEFSVFQIKAKINEEGLQIHTVKDENGEKKVVEFE